MAKIAFLGLGVMGFPMAGHLAAKGGHDVVVYNRTAAKAEAWVERYGGASEATPRAAAQGTRSGLRLRRATTTTCAPSRSARRVRSRA